MSDAEVAFDTLIYTDCRPGQGLQGSAGLQFQARSAGVGRDAMSLVQRHLLYEAPANWMRDRRPVEDYPRSFAHTWDGLLATAAGRYLGKEANGGREGNQLTHSIVTADPASYGPVRPAQLFGAPFWTGSPAPATSCPPVPPGWSPGPLTVPAVQEAVIAAPRGTELLVALLSALHRIDQPDGHRVLFIAEDPAAVLGWIAAATLLVPQRRALAIGFRVFTTNPAYASQPVVAVHPDWESTNVSVQNDSGYAVFDLTRVAWTPVPATGEADLLVRLFVEEDPYDVLDMVEVAAETGLSGLDALTLAGAMVRPAVKPSFDIARLAVSWLRDSPATLLPGPRGALVDQLADSIEQWPNDVLLALDDVATTGQVPADRVAAVRLALVRAELDQAVRHRTVAEARLAPLPVGAWSTEHQLLAEDLVVDALRADLSPAEFVAVLGVARRFNLQVRYALLEDEVRAFVADWADHPEHGYKWSDWPDPDTLTNALEAELTARVLAGLADEVGDTWWPARSQLPPLIADLPVDEAILAARMRHQDLAAREQTVREALGRVVGRPSPDAAVRRTVSALWRRTEPTVEELRLLAGLVPDGVELDPAVFAVLEDVLTDGTRPLRRKELDVARELAQRRIWRPPAVVHRLLADSDALRRVCEELGPVDDPRRFRRHLTDLDRAGPRMVSAYSGDLVAAVLRVRPPARLAEVLRILPAGVWHAFGERLTAELHPKGDPSYAFLAFQLSRNDVTPSDLRAALRSRVRQWLTMVPDRRVREATAKVSRLDADAEASWRKEYDEVRRSWFARRKSRGGD